VFYKLLSPIFSSLGAGGGEVNFSQTTLLPFGCSQLTLLKCNDGSVGGKGLYTALTQAPALTPDRSQKLELLSPRQAGSGDKLNRVVTGPKDATMACAKPVTYKASGPVPQEHSLG
jgi:hypothetical protein